jgi:hypothetical protein
MKKVLLVFVLAVIGSCSAAATTLSLFYQSFVPEHGYDEVGYGSLSFPGILTNATQATLTGFNFDLISLNCGTCADGLLSPGEVTTATFGLVDIFVFAPGPNLSSFELGAGYNTPVPSSLFMTPFFGGLSLQTNETFGYVVLTPEPVHLPLLVLVSFLVLYWGRRVSLPSLGSRRS